MVIGNIKATCHTCGRRYISGDCIRFQCHDCERNEIQQERPPTKESEPVIEEKWIPNWAGNRPKPDQCDECGSDIKSDCNRYTRGNSDLCKTCCFTDTPSPTVTVPRDEWERMRRDLCNMEIAFARIKDLPGMKRVEDIPKALCDVLKILRDYEDSRT